MNSVASAFKNLVIIKDHFNILSLFLISFMSLIYYFFKIFPKSFIQRTTEIVSASQ